MENENLEEIFNSIWNNSKYSNIDDYTIVLAMKELAKYFFLLGLNYGK